MDKIDRLIDATEHPESYNPTEINEMLDDPEVREVGELLDKTMSSLQTIVIPDIEEEWEKFENNNRRSGLPNSSWAPILFSRNIAASIAIAIVSFTAMAAIVGIGIHHLNSREATAAEMDTIAETEIVTSKPDSIKLIEDDKRKTVKIVVFDNEPFETIIDEIAAYYGCKVIYNEQTNRSLRLYFRWYQSISIEEVVERLNNFEQIHIAVKDKTITIN